MDKNADKTLTRESLLTHLKFMQEIGLEEVMPSLSIHPSCETASDKPIPETVTKATDRHRQELPTEVKSLQELQETLTGCTRCPLHAGRTKIVFGQGNPHADLMFVGEGPGADEDKQGLAFVGRAGQLLTDMIKAMKLSRDAVYIANIVKCRPPGNRAPEPNEMSACMPFLKQQIYLVNPKVIVCLGKTAAQALLQTETPISKIRGVFGKFEGIPLMPTFHPAYLLRNPAMKKPVWEDLQKVMRVLELE
ncbi:MAG TPA: uracil-DNA glycosylase [bacterium]|nr:uracil-DNA glycosylase [bacterium]